MVMLNKGLKKVRDLIDINLTKGQAGTGTSTATPEDSGLDEAQSGTLKTLSNNVTDRLLTTSFTLATTDGNGLSLTEFENRFTSGESFVRIRHTPQSKDNQREFEYTLTFELIGE